MMNEWGVPPVELHSLQYQYAKRLAEKGEKTARAKGRFLDRYTAEKMAGKYLSLYKELAGTR